ncbi:MAG: methyltransferase [Actinomycetota bacterium]|nr:methyltransferase [Actinomycetota bacterium]
MIDNAHQDGFDFGSLRRFPDVEAPNLFASDASDRLILADAAAALEGLDDGGLAIVGDRYGALTLAAASLYGVRGIRVHQDAMSAELALRNNAELLGNAGLLGTAVLLENPELPANPEPPGQPAVFRQLPLGEDLFSGAKVVLWQLPRGLDELAEVADQIARHAHPDVRVFAGGRLKHMTTSMNGVLSESFGNVRAGLARQKSRVLTATDPIRSGAAPRFPVREFNAELGLWLCAHGATFAGTRLDVGTRYLLEFLDRMKPDARTAVDLGCGSGVIAAVLAATRPQLQVTATDQSAAAVASAAATAAANGMADRISAVRDDAMAAFPAASAELILLNPPFHIGATVYAGAAIKLFDAAARVLAPSGELWTVYNNHLDYRSQLERRIGPTVVHGRNAKFTVVASVRR